MDLKSEGEYHPICASNGTATNYSVDAFLNLYEGADHTPVMCLQSGTSDKIVQNNLFYRQSEWRAFPTFFIMHRAATVTENGLVWSDPEFLNVKNSNERFLGVCPGRGTVAADGRIVFPLYDNATGNELASVIYSDDNGATWHRGERADNLGSTGKSSESQVVRLPDGTLRMYSRNTTWYIGYADSSDNGETWGQYTIDNDLHYGYNVMVSFINVDGYLTGPNGQVYENLILASYPWGNKASEHNRSNGVVRIGSIGDNNVVTWLNTDDIRFEGRYNYSCLTQLQADGKPSDTFGLLYEKDRSDGHMDIHFVALTVADLLGEGWTFSSARPVTELPIVPEIVLPDPDEEIDDPDTPLASLPFLDVDHDKWYAQSIANVVAKGLMEGVDELMFAPDDAMTRGMMAQALYALAQKPEIADPAAFLDVLDGVSYADAVAWGAANGLIKGYSETEFGGEDALNRQQLAALLYRYAEQIEKLDMTADADALNAFPDHDRVSAWAEEAMAWAVSKKLVEGRTDGTLDPRAEITRAEAAAILDRFSKQFLA